MKELILKLIPKNRFVLGVGMLAGGTAFAQGLAVLISPVLTRLYSPDEFGVFALYVSILAVIVVPASLCYQFAIPLPEEDESAANLLVLSLAINIILSVMLTIIIIFWHDWLAELVNIPELSLVLWVLPISMLGAGIYQTLNYWIMRRQAYIRILHTKWKQSLTMVLIQVSFGVWNAGTLGLVFGDTAGKVAGTGTLAVSSWRESKQLFRRVSLKGLTRVAYRYRRFPLLSSWSTVINSAGSQIPVLFLTAYYSPEVVGWYALCSRVLGVPLNIISGAVGQVYMAESARMALESPHELFKLFWKTLKTVLIIGVPIVGLIAMIAPWSFSLVFGGEWKGAGLYLQIFCPMFLLDLAANSIGGSIDVLERQDLHAIREIMRICVMLLSVLIAVYFSFPPLASMICLSAAGTIGYLVHLLLSLVAIRKYHLGKRVES